MSITTYLLHSENPMSTALATAEVMAVCCGWSLWASLVQAAQSLCQVWSPAAARSQRTFFSRPAFPAEPARTVACAPYRSPCLDTPRNLLFAPLINKALVAVALPVGRAQRLLFDSIRKSDPQKGLAGAKRWCCRVLTR